MIFGVLAFYFIFYLFIYLFFLFVAITRTILHYTTIYLVTITTLHYLHC